MANKVCGQCNQYLGGGDYGTCCALDYGLCYEDTTACKMFEQTDVCHNASSYVGGFRCSICGHFEMAEMQLDNYFRTKGKTFDYCPNCGARIERGSDNDRA